MKRHVFLLLLCSMLTLASCNYRSDAEERLAEVVQGAAYDNTKICWGLKKVRGKQPEVPAQWQELLKRYDGYYLGNTTEKQLYLTFDEGYENGYTAKILDVLKKTQTPAAFFVTGPYVKTEGELIRRMVDEGHIVGNHTINHPSMPDVSSDDALRAELQELDADFFELTGTHMRFMRPPRGEFSERTLALTRDLGYRSIFWSIAYADWDVHKQRGTEYAIQQVTEQFHNGAIVLLHAVSKDNANSLEKIIDLAKQQGYTFKSLEDL